MCHTLLEQMAVEIPLILQSHIGACLSGMSVIYLTAWLHQLQQASSHIMLSWNGHGTNS